MGKERIYRRKSGYRRQPPDSGHSPGKLWPLCGLRKRKCDQKITRYRLLIDWTQSTVLGTAVADITDLIWPIAVSSFTGDLQVISSFVTLHLTMW